jgi:N-acetylglucosamine transport system substrate-binding protein
MLKRTNPFVFAGLLVLSCALTLASGCGSQQRSKQGTVLEVAILQTGFELDFFKGVARSYEENHPGVKVEFWGDPQAIEKLRSRLIAGNPPDVMWSDVPYWKLIEEGQLCPLDDELETQAYGQNKKWKDTLMPDLLKGLTYQGHVYGIPLDFSIWLMWYNVDMFEKNGWHIPGTWTEFTSLCEKIKTAGIAPIAFQGRYPGYATNMYEILLQRIGGTEALFSAYDMEEGAWQSPAAVEAARKLQELADKYFEEGAMGMTHLEAQMEFARGKAAMVPCGTWLKTEMKNALPEGTRVSCFNYPGVEGGKGDPTAILMGTSYWLVPAKGKHPRVGADFLKFLTSLEIEGKFIREKLNPASAIGSEQYLPEEMSDVGKIVRSSRMMWMSNLVRWYPVFATNYTDLMASLLTGEITPEQFTANLEREASKVRADKSIIKHKVER